VYSFGGDDAKVDTLVREMLWYTPWSDTCQLQSLGEDGAKVDALVMV
jgi:hypothetical protein